MKVSPLLALDARHRAIGKPLVGRSIQRHPDRKATWRTVSDDLNAANGLATGPLPNGLKAFLAEHRIAQADRFEFHHLK
jgi:hypothetical protein